MMISGQDGILTRAGNAKVLNDKATIEEKIKLAVIASYNDDGELTVENVILNIEKSLPNAEITGEDFPITVTEEGYSYEIDAEGNAKIAIRAGIKVGDYVNYVPDTAEAYASTKLAESITGSSSNSAGLTQDTLTWQVLRIYEDGSMDLIGSPTSKIVYFKGALGYNNGVWVLNDICEKLYSKTSEGITARSVNLEDMEKWLTDDVLNEDGTVETKGGKTARAEYNNGAVVYGQTKTYKGSYVYKPDIYGKTENESDRYYSTPTDKTYTKEYGADGKTYTLEAKQTDYYMRINSTNYGDGAKVLATTSDYYWVASRYVRCDSYVAYFGLRGAGYRIGGIDLFFSSNDNYDSSSSLRPVVSLGSDIQVEKCSGTNSSSNMHTINWN